LKLMRSRQYKETRVKIDSPDVDLIEKILDVLDSNFLCVHSPIRESIDSGYHIFVNVREAT
jgi:hypothetical protein